MTLHEVVLDSLEVVPLESVLLKMVSQGNMQVVLYDTQKDHKKNYKRKVGPERRAEGYEKRKGLME